MLYNTDKTGLDSSSKHAHLLSELGVKRLVLPLAGTKQEKDISDFFRLGNTRENFIRLFIDFLDNLYSETMVILKPCEIDFNNPPASSEAVVSINNVPLRRHTVGRGGRHRRPCTLRQRRGGKPKEEKEKHNETELAGVARSIFSKQCHCTYADLCGQIQSILDVKERTAKSYVKFMREKEIVFKDPSNASYFIIGHI